MERPKEIKNRIEREITLEVQSFNVARLNQFLKELHELIQVWQERQVATKLENYVWVVTHTRT